MITLSRPFTAISRSASHETVPLFLMALVMAAALGPSRRNAIITISVALIPVPARVVPVIILLGTGGIPRMSQ